MQNTIFVGLDVHKATISVAIAGEERGGEFRHWGTINNRADDVRRLAEKLGSGGRQLHFCYEAGPCGYGLYRQLTDLGHVRARATAVRVLGKARQHLQGFLLRHGRVHAGKKGWTVVYRRWLTTIRFEHPAQQIVLQDYIHAVADAEARVERLTKQIAELLPRWSLAPVVEAVQAMRGVAFVVAVTVVAEVGDFSRFDNPRQLMAYLGLTPSEHSSGASVRRGGITKAGSSLARRALVEGAWSYRMQARVSRKLHDRIEALPQAVRDIAWKGQLRMCQRYRRLMAAGKPKVVATTAIAREMVGFIWAIARTVTPAHA